VPTEKLESELHDLRLDLVRWQAVLDSAQDAIISILPDGKITLFNRSAERIFGYPAEETLGHDVSMLMPAPYSVEHADYVRRYESTGERRAIGRVRFVEARRKSGEVFPIELSVSEARVGGDVLYTGIIRDVSERHRAEARLRELQKQAQQRERLADIGAITAKIVHDLGNPIGAISMHAQRIVRALKRDENQPLHGVRDPVDRILAVIRRLDDLVKEFLSFAREQRLQRREVRLERFLTEVRSFWEPIALSKQVQLVLQLPDPPPVLNADEEKLRRVLDNLVRNAIEAIDPGPGAVHLRVQVEGERIRLTVEDNGPGLPESLEVFRLFETTKPEGTGLGLAIAKQIVAAHGGNIQIERAQPHGAIFHIDLPK